MIEYQIKYRCLDTRIGETLIFIDRYTRTINNETLAINDVVTYIINRCFTRKEYGYKFIEIVSIEKIPFIGEETF